MTVLVLPAARVRDAEANLAAFVAKGRQSNAFGDVDWEAPIWEGVALAKSQRATAGRQGPRGLFFQTGKGGLRGETQSLPLQPPFVDFLKALLRRREDRGSQHIENHRRMISACRFLHDVLASDGYDPCRLTPAHFDSAARSALSNLTAGTSYRVGQSLEEVARWLDEYAVARVRIGWKNKIPRPSSDDRHGAEAEKRRTEKLPSEAALDALPRIANMSLDDPDLLRMRVVELLTCGGWRINELLTIPANCEVEEAVTERGAPKLGPDGKQIVHYGIRYFAEKGGGPTIKWIPSAMVDVAKRAIADIRRITDSVRADAVWMTANPGRVNVPGLDAGDPDGWIGVPDIGRLVGTGPRGGNQWCRVHKVPLTVISAHRIQARRRDVCAAILAEVPSVPSSFPVRLEEHLFLIRDNFVHRQRGVIEGSVRLLTDQMVGDFITGGQGRQSAFERYGFAEPDGSAIQVTTHQFRHWLNTLAQEGGVSQELIARWSGRKDVSQNAAYDHVSGRKLAQKVRDLVDGGHMKGPIANVSARLPPFEREKFLETEIASAHVTEIGLCVHDWSLTPCPSHLDCANCNRHVVDKGNQAQRVEAERQLAEVEHMLAIAETEANEGTYGAARWVVSHRCRRDALKAVLQVHRDQDIADGTLVHVKHGQAANTRGF